VNAVVAGTVGEALTAAVDALAAAGVDSPRLDAELLLAEATGRNRAQLAASPEAGVEAPAARAFGEMMRRRVRREPVAYILGRRGFRRIELGVDRRVLIPRPETELLVELALEVEPESVVDVGTGSGAIALAIADEVPQAGVVATDTSLDALVVAKANAAKLGVGERVRFELASLPDDLAVDLLVANLPYVPAGDLAGLEPEITEYEPVEALSPGPTGLEAIDGLLGELATAAARPDVIGLEVGIGQAATVADLMQRAGYERVEARPDLAGIDRVVVGWA
jgi:release factor glutamine methyltransferase